MRKHLFLDQTDAWIVGQWNQSHKDRELCTLAYTEIKKIVSLCTETSLFGNYIKEKYRTDQLHIIELNYNVHTV